MQVAENFPNKKINLLLIRHGDSEYNTVEFRNINKIIIQAQKLAMNSEAEVPDNAQDLTVKWSNDYLDCGISDLGKKQCEVKESEINKYEIDYVFCSPMRRCLATTFNLFKNHPSKPKVIVLPFLREELQSSCDIGSKILESVKLFPEFDFSFLDNLTLNPKIWQIETIQNKEKQQLILEKIQQKCQTDEDYENYSSQILIDIMKDAFPETIENRQEMANRAKEIKTVHLPKVLSELSIEKSVAIVSHSQFLFNFTAESFNDSFEPLGTKWFENCEIRPFQIEL